MSDCESNIDLNEKSDAESNSDLSLNEQVKNGIYKKALVINETILSSPKFKRINHGVSKIFGVDDPPPGFGLTYPKYYFLEQKKPRPMAPLKVWRGFNGNIYFEPIHCNNLKNAPSNNCECCTRDVDLKFKRTVTNLDDMRNYFESKTDRFPQFTAPAESISTDYQKELIAKHHRNQKPTGKKDLDGLSLSSTSLNSDKQLSQPAKDRLKPDKISTNKSILPNLSAVKKPNTPLKGLAYKEVSQRIKCNIPHLETHNYNKEPAINTGERDGLSKYIKLNKQNYKQMLKSIRKGITVNLYQPNAVSSSVLDSKPGARVEDYQRTLNVQSTIDEYGRGARDHSTVRAKTSVNTKHVNGLKVKGKQVPAEYFNVNVVNLKSATQGNNNTNVNTTTKNSTNVDENNRNTNSNEDKIHILNLSKFSFDSSSSIIPNRKINTTPIIESI